MDITVGSRYLFFDYPMASASLEINVTCMWPQFNYSTQNLTKENLISALLNGEMNLSQNGNGIKAMIISTEDLLDINLNIRPEDLTSIENATSTIVHWFVDCHYVRKTKEFKTQEIFTEPNKTHHIEALVEASFDAAPTKNVPSITSKLITNWRTQHKADLPFVCHNKSQTAPHDDKIYGYFQRNITVFGTSSSR